MANFGLPEGRTWNLFGLPDWLKRQFPEGWHKQPFGRQVPTMLPGLTLPRDRLGAMGEEIGLFGITTTAFNDFGKSFFIKFTSKSLTLATQNPPITAGVMLSGCDS